MKELERLLVQTDALQVNLVATSSTSVSVAATRYCADKCTIVEAIKLLVLPREIQLWEDAHCYRETNGLPNMATLRKRAMKGAANRWILVEH